MPTHSCGAAAAFSPVHAANTPLCCRQAQEVEAIVTGQLPAWLSGSLLVNGGGDYSRMQHMFDGFACLTKVRVEGGKAWGRQRYLDTQAYRAYKQRGAALCGLCVGHHHATTVWIGAGGHVKDLVSKHRLNDLTARCVKT